MKQKTMKLSEALTLYTRLQVDADGALIVVNGFNPADWYYVIY